MPHALILSRHAQEYASLIATANLPDLQVLATSSTTTAIEQGRDCAIVFGEPNLIRLVLSRLPALRWVQATWAGVEPLLDPNLRRDYVLTNARSVFGAPMAEYVFGYLLAYERRLLQRYTAQQFGRWDPTPPGTIRGKRLGLLGVGSIGAELARTAKHFGLHVKGYTHSSEDCSSVDVYYHGADLQAFVTDLDYLVSALPNTPHTRHLVNAGVLSALRAKAIFINVGRGSAVDEVALAKALNTGRLAGAVLDVFQEEPLPPTHPFWETPNLLITSHTAAITIPSEMTRVFVENYQHFIRGEALQYRVDFERGY